MAESQRQPMTTLHRTVLQKCRVQLVQDLDVSSILGELIQEDILNSNMQELISSQETRAMRVERFLDILPTRGDHAFFKFKNALATDYPFLVDILDRCQCELNAEVPHHSIDRLSRDVLHTANIKQKQPKADEDEDDGYDPVIYASQSLTDDDVGYECLTDVVSAKIEKPPPPQNEPVPYVLLRDCVVKSINRQVVFDGSVQYVDLAFSHLLCANSSPEIGYKGVQSGKKTEDGEVSDDKSGGGNYEHGGRGEGAKSKDIGDTTENKEWTETGDVQKGAESEKLAKSGADLQKYFEPVCSDDEDGSYSSDDGENVQSKDIEEAGRNQLSASTDGSPAQNDDLRRPSMFEMEADCIDGPHTFDGCSTSLWCNGVPKPIPLPRKSRRHNGNSQYATSSVCAAEAGDVKLSRGDLVFMDPEGKHTDGEVMVCDIYSRCFLLPKHYISRYGDPSSEAWYYPLRINSRHATMILSRPNVQGCFLVYKPMHTTVKHVYNISICADNNKVAHYHVYEYNMGEFCLKSDGVTFPTIQGLVEYHKKNRGVLCCRLQCPPSKLQDRIRGLDDGDHPRIIPYRALSISPDTDSMLLGSGRFSRVFQAQHNVSQVAIKVPDQSTDNPWTLAEFHEEARILSLLDHPNILRYVGFVNHPNPLLVMELLPMGNLKQYLIKRQKDGEQQGKIAEVDLQTRFEMCYQLVCALKYLHYKAYIIHRDIAARNILLVSEEKIKLSDFGRARFVVDDKYKGENGDLMAVRWAAPEVMTSLMYSTASDIWAAGVVFWEIFSDGGEPYSGKTNVEVTGYVVERNKLACPTTCPDALYRTMMTCWHFEAKKRPTPEDLSDMLQQKSFYKHLDESLKLEVSQEQNKIKKKSLLNKLFQSPVMKSKKTQSRFHVTM